jgi:hypothetical protein
LLTSVNKNTYITYTNNNVDKKTANTRLKNLIHPILVRKSYLYRGIPPLINTSIDMSIKNLRAVIVASNMFVVINISGISN